MPPATQHQRVRATARIEIHQAEDHRHRFGRGGREQPVEDRVDHVAAAKGPSTFMTNTALSFFMKVSRISFTSTPITSS